MFPPRKILFPIDFSERSTAVVPTAAALARKFDAELELMNVKNPMPLEDSIALYERGQALKAHCEQKLRSAESRLEKIVQAPKGSVAAEPLKLG